MRSAAPSGAMASGWAASGSTAGPLFDERCMSMARLPRLQSGLPQGQARGQKERRPNGPRLRPREVSRRSGCRPVRTPLSGRFVVEPGPIPRIVARRRPVSRAPATLPVPAAVSPLPSQSACQSPQNPRRPARTQRFRRVRPLRHPHTKVPVSRSSQGIAYGMVTLPCVRRKKQQARWGHRGRLIPSAGSCPEESSSPAHLSVKPILWHEACEGRDQRRANDGACIPSVQ